MEFEAVENYFEEYYIRTLAKGKTSDGFRYYFYGVEVCTYIILVIEEKDQNFISFFDINFV